MSIERGVLKIIDDGMVGFHCPGCNEMHIVNVDPADRGHAPVWGFNGNYETPTFTPSINVTGVRRLTEDERTRLMAGETIEPVPRVCHSFVNDGQIQFLNDCTHTLVGQTVALAPFSPTGETL